MAMQVRPRFAVLVMVDVGTAHSLIKSDNNFKLRAVDGNMVVTRKFTLINFNYLIYTS